MEYRKLNSINLQIFKFPNHQIAHKRRGPETARRINATMSVNTAAPIIDQMIGKVLPPILMANNSGRPNFPAIHMPILARMFQQPANGCSTLRVLLPGRWWCTGRELSYHSTSKLSDCIIGNRQ